MTLPELQNQVLQLTFDDRLELVSTIIQSLQGTPQSKSWQFLVARPHPWRKQLCVKGRKLLAATVWSDMIANGMTPIEAADSWDLPIAAVLEALEYCQTHQDLLKLEAEEERFRLLETGITLEPIAAG